MNTRTGRVVFLAIVAGACSALDGPARPLCSQTSTIVSATSEARPVFTWTPECRVDQILVTNVLAPSVGPVIGQVQWGIATLPVSNGIVAPVVYGQLAVGMETTHAPTSLNHLQQYEVLLGVHGILVGHAFFYIP